MPDDPFFEEMDPVLKLWMYNNWLEDQRDNSELAKNHAYLIGSFTNPEAVKSLMGDGKTVVETSESDFEESIKIVEESSLLFNNPNNKINRKRKPRKIK